MKRIILATLLLTSPAFAASALAADEVSYKFDLTPAEINIVAEGLGMLPYGKVAPLMAKLQQQINGQTKPEAKSQVPVQEKKD